MTRLIPQTRVPLRHREALANSVPVSRREAFLATGNVSLLPSNVALQMAFDESKQPRDPKTGEWMRQMDPDVAEFVRQSEYHSDAQRMPVSPASLGVPAREDLKTTREKLESSGWGAVVHYGLWDQYDGYEFRKGDQSLIVHRREDSGETQFYLFKLDTKSPRGPQVPGRGTVKSYDERTLERDVYPIPDPEPKVIRRLQAVGIPREDILPQGHRHQVTRTVEEMHETLTANGWKYVARLGAPRGDHVTVYDKGGSRIVVQNVHGVYTYVVSGPARGLK